MAGDSSVPDCIDSLLSDFRKFDRAVDVVSVFEMLFVGSDTALPASVEAFERFPRVTHPDGHPATPDFTVLYRDGRGLVGEIAYLPLAEQGVDSLSSQIARYDGLIALPSPGGPIAVDTIDVMVLVPLAIGPDAVRRVQYDRRLNQDHPYSPGTPPVIVQFGFDEGRYNFQRIADPENGNFRDETREDAARLSVWFQRNIAVRPDRFREVKASRAFVNDPVNPLYLATHLWAKTFATMAGQIDGSFPRRIEITAVDLAAALRADHGGGVHTDDVVRALRLLERARMAKSTDGNWVIAWDAIRGSSKDLAQILAERVCKSPSGGTMAKLRRNERAELAPPRTPTLFDASTSLGAGSAGLPAGEMTGEAVADVAHHVIPSAARVAPRALPAGDEETDDPPAPRSGT